MKLTILLSSWMIVSLQRGFHSEIHVPSVHVWWSEWIYLQLLWVFTTPSTAIETLIHFPPNLVCFIIKKNHFLSFDIPPAIVSTFIVIKFLLTRCSFSSNVVWVKACALNSFGEQVLDQLVKWVVGLINVIVMMWHNDSSSLSPWAWEETWREKNLKREKKSEERRKGAWEQKRDEKRGRKEGAEHVRRRS